MSISGLRNFLLGALLALAALTMLPACSSTEEAPPPEETSTETGGGSGLPCDVDPGQPECLK